MKYFIDTEFHEYSKQPNVLGINAGKPINTIELISIGIVSEPTLVLDKNGVNVVISETYREFNYWLRQNEKNPKDYICIKNRDSIRGLDVKSVTTLRKPKDYNEIMIDINLHYSSRREYYAICNEFDLKAAWNNEWLRENVLKSIWEELSSLMNNYHKTYYWKSTEWSYKGLKRLLKWKGKSKKQIAKEIIEFVQDYKFESMMKGKRYDSIFGNGVNNTFYFNIDDEKSDIYVGETCSDKPEFYAYYADYDWVVFCWLFGRMVDLPEGFPMYCIDLKQELDSKVKGLKSSDFDRLLSDGSFGYTNDIDNDLEKKLEILKRDSNNYPKQINNHNALADAKWNYELYKFIKTY